MLSLRKKIQGSAFLKNGRHTVVGLPNKLVVLFLRRKWLYIGISFAVLLLILFGAVIKDIFTIAILTLVASFSTYYKKYVKFTIGLELVTLATVVTTIKYGPAVGALVGFVSSTAAEVIPQLIDPSSFFWILSLPVSAYAVSFFHSLGVPLLWLGLIAITVQFIISEPIRLFSGDGYLKTMGTVNIVTTAGWTIFWFSFLAPWLISVI